MFTSFTCQSASLQSAFVAHRQKNWNLGSQFIVRFPLSPIRLLWLYSTLIAICVIIAAWLRYIAACILLKCTGLCWNLTKLTLRISFCKGRRLYITEGTDFSHLLTGDAAKKYGMSNNTSKTRMLGTGCYTQFWKAWGLLDSSYLLGLDLCTFLVWYECVFHSVSFLL